MHGNANNIVSDEFALAGMQTATDLQIERAHRIADCTGATYGARWPVERGKETVAGGIDFVATEPTELVAHRVIMSVEKLPPWPEKL